MTYMRAAVLPDTPVGSLDAADFTLRELAIYWAVYFYGIEKRAKE